VFLNLATFQAQVNGGLPLETAKQNALNAMATAGAELATYIKQQIVAKGATHVVLVTLPDISETPMGYGYAQTPGIPALLQGMTVAFNTALTTGDTGVQNTSGVLIADLYTQNKDQTAHPAQYGVTNVTDQACDHAKLAWDSSLVCSTATLIDGDTSHYAFADGVHPTPYGYKLIAQFVTDRMLKAGWL